MDQRAVTNWADWWSWVCAGLDGGAAPGGAAWIAVAGEVVVHDCHGWAAEVPQREPLRRDQRFDLASVTKAISTTSCVMALVEDGRVALDAAAAEYLPELAQWGKGAVTVRHLLTHTAGLAPFLRLYESSGTREEMQRRVLQAGLETTPGSRVTYSDLGFMTLGFLVEQVTGQRQDRYLAERVLAPLGLADELGYGPVPAASAVATEDCPWRQRVMRGEVHDENAYACAGVAGHAGLFGTVAAVGRFGQALLSGRLLAEATRRLLFAERHDVAARQFWLGWKRLDYESGDPLAFGHDGFTGTLLWVCPARRLVVALLTNRVHPSRDNRRLYDRRPAWVNAAARLASG